MDAKPGDEVVVTRDFPRLKLAAGQTVYFVGPKGPEMFEIAFYSPEHKHCELVVLKDWIRTKEEKV